MSSTTTDHQFIGAESTLPEPHFDEEATILSARPVVPLEEVESLKSKASLTRPWILGLGLVAALLVGILATVTYYARSNGDDAKLLQHVEAAAGVEGNSATEPANSFFGPASPQPDSEVEKPTEMPRQIPVNNRSDKASVEPGNKPRPRLVAVYRGKRSNNHIEGESEEDRRAARREARRERRRAERERRDGKSSDELLRIRDIFEGSPRP